MIGFNEWLNENTELGRFLGTVDIYEKYDYLHKKLPNAKDVQKMGEILLRVAETKNFKLPEYIELINMHLRPQRIK